MHGSVLIKNIDLTITMNREREIIKDASILIEDGKINKIIKAPDHNTNAGKIIDGRGKAALPGFINAHAHGLSILGRGGLYPDRRLRDWLTALTHPVYAGTGIEEAVPALRAFACECIRSGITTVLEMEGYINDEYTGVVIDTLVKSGLRIVYAPMVQDTASPQNIKDLEDHFLSTGKESVSCSHHHALNQRREILDLMEVIIRKYHHSYNDQVRVFPAASNINEISIPLFKELLELAEKYNTLMTIHVAESALLESEKLGLSAIDYLESAGCLNERMLLAHAVQIMDRDIRLIKKSGARVAHNPAANCYLGSGVAPLNKYLLAGIPISIGLDNPNCNDGLNILADLKLALMMQKAVTRDPGCMTAEKALEIATIEGASALNWQDSIGSLEAGKSADIILIDLDYLHLKPLYHLPSVLIYQTKGHEIDTVVIGGKVVMENKIILYLDEKKIAADLADTSNRIIKKMNLSHLTNRGWEI